MKSRTIIIGAAAAILTAGWLISADRETDCRVTSHSIIEENGRAKVIGTSNCKDGAAQLVLDGVPFDVTVKSGVFGAWIDYQDGKPVSATDVRS